MCLDSDIKTTITLITKDNVKFEVEKHLFQQTEEEQSCKSNIIDIALKNNPEETEININIQSNILPTILEFLKYHHNNPMKRLPFREINFKEEGDLCKWDIDFIQQVIDMSKDNPPLTFIIQLLASSHWANFESLNSLCASKIASIIKNKSPEMIYAMMGTLEEDNCCHYLPIFVNKFKEKNDYDELIKYCGKIFADKYWNMDFEQMVKLFITDKIDQVSQNIINKKTELSNLENINDMKEEDITKEIEELKNKYDNESRDRSQLLFKYKQILNTNQKLNDDIEQLENQLNYMKTKY